MIPSRDSNSSPYRPRKRESPTESIGSESPISQPATPIPTFSPVPENPIGTFQPLRNRF